MKIGEVFGSQYVDLIYGMTNSKLLKSISSSGISMFIDFKKETKPSESSSEIENATFTAIITYKEINYDCKTLLDLKNNILMSPHHSDITSCNWLITFNFGSYIILDFTFIEVNTYLEVILTYLSLLKIKLKDGCTNKALIIPCLITAQ